MQVLCPTAAIVLHACIVIPYNLKVQLIWACYEKYPKVTMETIELLRKYKKEILNLEGYAKKPNWDKR